MEDGGVGVAGAAAAAEEEKGGAEDDRGGALARGRRHAALRWRGRGVVGGEEGTWG